MSFSKYFFSYTAIYKKAFEDCLSRKWLFGLSGACSVIVSMIGHAINFSFYGPAYIGVLTGDKEKITEAVKHSVELIFSYKMPFGILLYLFVDFGPILLRMLLNSFVDAVIFRTLLKIPKNKALLWAWTLQSGRKYFPPILYIDFLVILVLALPFSLGHLLLGYLMAGNFQTIQDSFWIKYVLPSLSFMLFLPVYVLAGFSKAQIVDDKIVKTSIQKAWLKLKAGNGYGLKGTFLMSVLLSVLWFGFSHIYMIFGIDPKEVQWVYWLNYLFSCLDTVLIGTYLKALYCRFSTIKVPAFASK